jgi:hypothetical protein
MRSRLTGDWNGFGVKLKSLLNFGDFTDDKVAKDAEQLLNIIQGHIANQDLPWKPLSESTLRQKDNKLIYIESGELVSELAVKKIEKNKYFVGAPQGITHSQSGLDVSKLMEYLEYGTDRIPPRPLIKPSYEEFQSKFILNWVSYLKEFFSE